MQSHEDHLFSVGWYQSATALQRALFKPEFLALDAVDLSRPALWVGNHTLYGLLDAPVLAHELMQRGIRLYSLGDRGHFHVPGWRTLLEKSAVVEGSPENCAKLMQQGKHVLVFPGGAREVTRRKGENYKLIWKQRTGFARLALEHGYDIQPFASMGPDDTFDILLDANDVTGFRAWRWLSGYEAINSLTRQGDVIPPVIKGIGPTLIPRPQRFYFGFGDRIATKPIADGGYHSDDVMALRTRVASSIESELEKLEAHRKTDREENWSALRRWLT